MSKKEANVETLRKEIEILEKRIQILRGRFVGTDEAFQKEMERRENFINEIIIIIRRLHTNSFSLDEIKNLVSCMNDLCNEMIR